MTAEQHGTEELQKILFFIVEAGNVADAIEKQKNWIGKATAILPLTDEFIALLSLNPKKVTLEWKDFSKEEKEKLFVLAKEKYDIPDDQKESLIEEGLHVVSKLVDMTKEIVDYSKKWRK